jgi:hypothetical protein
MTPSLRLLLEDFLGLMREEGELDVFLPLLLSAMGHEVVFGAQKGTRQYGVDISSVGKDDDGKKKLFLWLVKRGNISRRDWSSGEQSIRQSMEDAGDIYMTSHIAPQHSKLPCKLVVLTNGDFNPALTLTMSSYLKVWSKKHRAQAVVVNGSTLAAWTERFLLDEHVLPPENKVLLRRMLANVSSPELSISVGRTLIEKLVRSADEPVTSDAARTKRWLGALRGIRTALSVLQVWAHSERNQLAPYRLAEFTILRVWAHWGEQVRDSNPVIAREYAQLLMQMAGIAEAYHEQFQPYYVTQDGFANAFPDSLLVTDAVFDQLGRLGLQGSLLAFFAVDGNSAACEGLASVYVNRVIALLRSHACTQSPSYDHQSGAIHAALLLLLIGGRRQEAKVWVESLAVRLATAARSTRHWPLSAPFEEALAVRHGEAEMSPEFMSTTTLVPLLLVWASVLEMNELYGFIKRDVVAAIPNTTLNFWNSDEGYDKLVANQHALHAHGVAEAVLHLPDTPAEFLRSITPVLPGVQSIESSPWYQSRAAYVPLLAALHWHLQVPREMLVKHAAAVAEYPSLTGNAGQDEVVAS